VRATLWLASLTVRTLLLPRPTLPLRAKRALLDRDRLAFADLCSPVVLVRYRLHRGKPQYLVHWKCYGDYENSWVPAVDLTCPELLAEFHRAADGSSTRGG
jgi:hypothetical protein